MSGYRSRWWRRGARAVLAALGIGLVATAPAAIAGGNANTTTGVVSSPNPPTVGNNATFTATVGTTPPSQVIPTGSVRFVVDGGSFIDQPLNNGVASVNLFNFAGYSGGFTLGIHTLQAFYLGTPGFNTSNSGAPSFANSTQWAVGFATTTSVTSSVNPSSPGQAVTFTATICPPPSVAAPTGSVQFVIDGTDFGSPVTLGSPATDNCTAFTSGSTSNLSIAGSPHAVTAVYTPTVNFAPSSGSLVGGQVVTQPQDMTRPIIMAMAVKHTTSGDVPYVFGAWSTDQVTLEFVCVDPPGPDGEPVSGVTDENLPDKNFSNDGIYDVEDFIGPEHGCVDNAGNAAAPFGSSPLQILVDRHAPTCTVSPATQSVPNAPGQLFTRSVTVASQDGTLTGLQTVVLKSVKTNGLGSFKNWTTGVLDTQGKFEGVSEAIYTLTYQVRDEAGHKATCAAKVTTAR